MTARHAIWLVGLFVAAGAIVKGSGFVNPPVILSGSVDSPLLPLPRRSPKVREMHGDKFVDDYFWLREKSNPEVTKYLEAENAYTDSVMKPLDGLQERLYKEMLGRIKETDLSVPAKDGAYFYYSRTEQGKQYSIYCRKKGSLDASEEVYLDLNELGKAQKFISLGALDVSDDGNFLAYSQDNTGFREYELHVKDLRTGKTLADTVPKVIAVAWAKDNKTLFYTTPDAAKRSYRVYRHTVGEAAHDLLYEEKDERFSVYVSRSRSKDYLLDGSRQPDRVGSAVSAGRSAEGRNGRWCRRARSSISIDVDHRGDLFYIRTNKDGRNFALATAPASNPEKANWKIIVPHRPAVMLQSVTLFKNHLVLGEREAALPQIRITNLDDQRHASHHVPRAGLHGDADADAGVRDECAAVWLSVVRAAELGVRLRHGQA